MNRKEAEAYAQGAIEALELCKTDADLVAWHDKFMGDFAYLVIPRELALQMEQAYQGKLAHIWGIGAG